METSLQELISTEQNKIPQKIILSAR